MSDHKDSPGMAETGTNPDGSERTRLDQLPRQANLAAWPTPMAGTPAQNGNNAAGNIDFSRRTEELARSVDFGLMPTGFLAAIQRYPEALSGGQLNPEHSLWLMAIPTAWVCFVSQATQSLSARRKRSSKRTAKQGG